MSNRSKRRLLATAVAGTLASAPALATITPVNAGSESYFGSQSNGFLASDPAGWTGPGPAAPAVSFPYYPVATPLAGVPLPPTSPPLAPVNTGAPNNFQVPGGYTYAFSDGLNPSSIATKATAIIDHNYLVAGTNVLDARVDFPNWRFDQGASATGYAYQQINFWSAYSVTTSLTGGAPVAPLFISGSTSTLGTPFVQFDAAITYTWYDINASGVLTAPGTTLGTVFYSWSAPGGAAFLNQIINPTGLVASTPAGSTGGLLELTGHAWIAGDPFQVTLSSAPVPEPSTFGLMALGALALLMRCRR
jgi:hypothetical protein